MPSQDLLYPILPRAPAIPHLNDMPREVNAISKKHAVRKYNSDNSDPRQRQQAYPLAKRDRLTTKKDPQQPDPEHQIDIFV